MGVLPLLAGLAVATERVKLGTAVISTAFRNRALLAKIASTVNEISGGRLIVGLGAGWNEPEFRTFGYPTDHRYSRFAEALEIFHGLITTGRVDFEGRFYSAPDCELAPYDPAQRPGIMIGSTGRRMIDLAARYAGTWNVWLPQSVTTKPEGADGARPGTTDGSQNRGARSGRSGRAAGRPVALGA